MAYSQLEKVLGDEERARAIFQLAIQQSSLGRIWEFIFVNMINMEHIDMPEVRIRMSVKCQKLYVK
jgi:hypothetical protein